MKYFWKPWLAEQEQGQTTEQVKEPAMLAESRQGCVLTHQAMQFFIS